MFHARNYDEVSAGNEYVLLDVTPEQAVGGTSAMLGLAMNPLISTDYSQLAKELPMIDKLSGGSGNLAV
ncbi:hypothetical protein PS619_04647 [Pseudomonas fluorescens]|nr:hypothetical protein PS681_02095 [Pseudomonas fluorescens]VVN27529.1 hypothetical protein PS619_04647 [Pseudomonas fluorescens]VVN51611.1 hypothetical protein PS684_00728 [Pseudomonas fluorescens]